MRNFFVGLLVAVAVLGAGCGKNFDANIRYAESDMKEAFAADKKYCAAIARGKTPIPPVNYSYIPDQAYRYSGTVYDGRNQYQYSGTGYVDNSQARMHQGAQNLGFAIGYAIAVTRRENECLENLGWKKKAEISEEDAKKIKFNEEWKTVYAKHKGDPRREEVFQCLTYFFNDLSYSDTQKVMDKTIETNGDFLDQSYAHIRDLAEKGLLYKKEGENNSP